MVTEHAWLVKLPLSAPLLHTRVSDEQLDPHATDDAWYAVTFEPLAMLPPHGSVQGHGATEQLVFDALPLSVPLLQTRTSEAQLDPQATEAVVKRVMEPPCGTMVPLGAVQEFLHAPNPSQVWFEPHVVPMGFAVLSMHCEVPVLHEVTPLSQMVGLVPQACPAVHDTQFDVLSHTRFVPQLVPGAFEVPSMHTGEPLVHTVVPFLHCGFGFDPQPAPTVHATQLPEPLHTRFAPHEVPAAWLIAESTQVEAPDMHEVTPTLHEVGFPLQP